MVAIALYQPDIPQNAGNILRLGACLGIPVHVIGPAGFDLSDRAVKRAGMDYLDHAEIVRHVGWPGFDRARRDAGRRLILFTTHGDRAYFDFPFLPSDMLVFGRESGGVPEEVHAVADARLAIPIRPGLRSLNIATAAAMAVGEALRQTAGFPAVASGRRSV